MNIPRFVNAVRHPFTEYQVQRAKTKHRKVHQRCAVCGVAATFFSRNNDVHHKTPVHVDPNAATDKDNLVTMCRLHHWLVGHLRNWRTWNRGVIKHIEVVKHAYTEIEHEKEATEKEESR